MMAILSDWASIFIDIFVIAIVLRFASVQYRLLQLRFPFGKLLVAVTNLRSNNLTDRSRPIAAAHVKFPEGC